MTILTLQQYYNEIWILQQHVIYNVLNGDRKISAIFPKPFYQLYKYSFNIASLQWNIFKIFPQYYSATWVVFFVKYKKACYLQAYHSGLSEDGIYKTSLD